VALAIGISVVQRSLSDISTSTKIEESSRAFSAAEAGIEQALSTSGNVNVTFTENQSSAKVTGGDLIPAVPEAVRQEALEFPPLSKEQTAHVWLADYNSTTNPPQVYYTQNTLDVYWGNSASDKAALELTLVYYEAGQYKSKKWYLDSAARSSLSNFESVTCTANYSLQGYQCKKTLDSLPSDMMMLTARLLYNTTSQPFAVQAVGTCGKDCSIPPQAKIFISIGTAGQTQRSIKLFQIAKVAPPYFDYGIFSVGEINK